MMQRATSVRSTHASAARLRTAAKAKEPKGQNTDGMNGEKQFSIIAVDRFIQATRDSGYKSTSSAVAELVDNAIQADATRIRITVCHATDGERGAVELLVQDNGTGMDPFTLRTALRFGGTTRFNQRTGLGRYGMGLPNSSLSQARRVTVYTWRTPGEVYMSYLDVDEIAAGDVTEVPTPCRVTPPTGANGHRGTVVVWSRCDRLDNRRISTIARKLLNDLGRQFRCYLTDRVKITVNGDHVEPIDPLYLNLAAKHTGATLIRPADRVRGRGSGAERQDSRRRPSPDHLFAAARRGLVQALERREAPHRHLEGRRRLDRSRRTRGGLRVVLHGRQEARKLRRLVALRDPIRPHLGRSVWNHPH